jgi:hypothetical protein
VRVERASPAVADRRRADHSGSRRQQLVSEPLVHVLRRLGEPAARTTPQEVRCAAAIAAAATGDGRDESVGVKWRIAVRAWSP